MKHHYLRLKLISNKKYILQVYSSEGKPVDFVGSYIPGVGGNASILRLRLKSFKFWLVKGLRPTRLLKKILLLSNVV